MYTKDKNVRITLRLNEAQFEYVKQNADLLGVSPSEFLRMVVNLTMASAKKAEEVVKEKLEEEGKRRENESADSNDQLQQS